MAPLLWDMSAVDLCTMKMISGLRGRQGSVRAICSRWVEQCIARGDVGRVMEPLLLSLLDQATSFFLHEQVHTSILIILTRNLNIFSRFYIEAKLHTDLKTELVKLLSSLEADKHMTRLVSLMSAAQSRPFSVPPATMASLCKHLATLNPEYTAIQPQLFSSYLYNCPE